VESLREDQDETRGAEQADAKGGEGGEGG